MSYSSWLGSFNLFAFAFIICINRSLSSTSEAQASYVKHCSFLIPHYEITAPSDGDSLPSLSTSYFTGSDRFRPVMQYQAEHDVPKNLQLRLSPDHYQTTAAGVYSVEGFLYITFAYGSHDNPKLKFPMNGFWSEKSRKLCMVGSATWKGTDLDAVLKLRFAGENPTVYTAVVSGSLESTASAGTPAYFDPILIFSFPPAPNYNYSLVSDETGAGFPSRKADSLSLDSVDFCTVLERGLRFLDLEYPPECAERRPGCSPIGFADGLLPENLSVTSIQCDKRSKRARFLARFQNSSNHGDYSFPLNSTAIGEARWDYQSNRIIGVACGILNPSLHLENSVGYCSMRLSLRLPSVRTMRNDVKIVGEVWSPEAEGIEDSGYFTPIFISSNADSVGETPPDFITQRYEYRELDGVRESCREKKAGKEGKEYPDGSSDKDMNFDLSIRNGAGNNIGHVYFTAVRAEKYLYPVLHLPLLDRESDTGEVKMRYKATLDPSFPGNSTSKASIDWPMKGSSVAMTAEGVYDPETGQLCMVACRKLVINSVASFDDCEVTVELEVPPSNERQHIKGIIGSTRPPTDALHFDDLIMSV